MKKSSMVLIGAALIALLMTVACVMPADSSSAGEEEQSFALLIMDQYGVYQIVGSDGETVTEVLQNTDFLEIDIVENSWGNSVNAISGLAMKSDYSGYWALYTYNGEAWTLSDVGIDGVKTADFKAAGLFYVLVDSDYKIVTGGPEKLATAIPDLTSKAYAGEDYTNMFYIESPSGFHIVYGADVPEAVEVDNAAASAQAFVDSYFEDESKGFYYEVTDADEKKATIVHHYTSRSGEKTSNISVTVEADIDAAYATASERISALIDTAAMGSTKYQAFDYAHPDAKITAVMGQLSSSSFCQFAIAVDNILITNVEGGDYVYLYLAGSANAEQYKDLIDYLCISVVGYTVFDAFYKAADVYNLPFTPSIDSSSGARNGIYTLFGMKMEQIEGQWFWWNQCVPSGSAWVGSDKYMNGLSAADVTKMAMVFGQGAMPSFPVPGTEASKVLIIDQYGVYTVIGASASDLTVTSILNTALDNGVIDIVIAENTWGHSVDRIGYLSQKADYSAYWALYVMTDDGWVSSSVGIDKCANDGTVYGLFYVGVDSTYAVVNGGPELLAESGHLPVITSDTVTNKGPADGVVFSIESASGFNYYIYGAYAGDATLLDALNAAVAAYGVPADLSSTGINTLFGLWSSSDSVEIKDAYDNVMGYRYTYWGQYYMDEEGQWAMTPAYLSGLKAADYPIIGLNYTEFDYYLAQPVDATVAVEGTGAVEYYFVDADGTETLSETLKVLPGTGVTYDLVNGTLYFPVSDKTGYKVVVKDGTFSYYALDGDIIDSGDYVMSDSEFSAVFAQTAYAVDKANQVAEYFVNHVYGVSENYFWTLKDKATKDAAILERHYTSKSGEKTAFVSVTYESDIDAAYKAAYDRVSALIGTGAMGGKFPYEAVRAEVDNVEYIAVMGQLSNSSFCQFAIRAGNVLITNVEGGDYLYVYLPGSDNVQAFRYLIEDFATALKSNTYDAGACVWDANVAAGYFTETYVDTTGATWTVAEGSDTSKATIVHTYTSRSGEKTNHVAVTWMGDYDAAFQRVYDLIGTPAMGGKYPYQVVDARIEGADVIAVMGQLSSSSFCQFAIRVGEMLITNVEGGDYAYVYLSGSDNTQQYIALLTSLATNTMMPENAREGATMTFTSGSGTITHAANADKAVYNTDAKVAVTYAIIDDNIDYRNSSFDANWGIVHPVSVSIGSAADMVYIPSYFIVTSKVNNVSYTIYYKVEWLGGDDVTAAINNAGLGVVAGTGPNDVFNKTVTEASYTDKDGNVVTYHIDETGPANANGYMAYTKYGYATSAVDARFCEQGTVTSVEYAAGKTSYSTSIVGWSKNPMVSSDTFVSGSWPDMIGAVVTAPGKILIEDQYGVYTVIQQSGETVTDALQSAMDNGLIEVTINETSWGHTVDSIGYLAQKSDYSAYWALYCVNDDGEWEMSPVGIDKCDIMGKSYALCYVEVDSEWKIVAGGPTMSPAELADKPALNGVFDAVVFDMQSKSGFSFCINGYFEGGDSILVAFKNACDTYGVPASLSDYGINHIYALWDSSEYTSIYDAFENLMAMEYTCWGQYVLGDDGKWVMTSEYMSNIPAVAGDVYGIHYTEFTYYLTEVVDIPVTVKGEGAVTIYCVEGEIQTVSEVLKARAASGIAIDGCKATFFHSEGVFYMVVAEAAEGYHFVGYADSDGATIEDGDYVLSDTEITVVFEENGSSPSILNQIIAMIVKIIDMIIRILFFGIF